MCHAPLHPLSLPPLARVPDREPGEDVDMPDVYVVEDNGELHPGLTFSCQVNTSHAPTIQTM